MSSPEDISPPAEVVTLRELIKRYASKEKQNEAFKYTSAQAITDSPVSPKIAGFLEKFQKQDVLTNADFEMLNKELEDLKKNQPKIHDAIVGLLNYQSLQMFDLKSAEIEEFQSLIEKNLKEGKELSLPPEDLTNEYRGLLNAYRLTQGQQFRTINGYGYDFPGITPYEDASFRYSIPFALNTLMIMNKLPKGAEYCGIPLDSPIYPKNRDGEEQKVPLKRGIKDSKEYFPFKKNSKLFKGDVEDVTFMATNGKKILFVRGSEPKRYAANAVLASKVASFISKEHFSSERMLNSKQAASRKLGQYAVSVADPTVRTERKKYIEEDKKVFPGTGMVDEVLNFVQEYDPNIENFGFSSRNMNEAHISKIDFDRCFVSGKIEKNQYEKDILTRPRGGLYHGLEHVKTNQQYIDEKLHTRLKLSLMTSQLFEAMAEKSYDDPKEREEAVKELISRSQIALELFLEHPQAKQFLEKDPNILTNLFKEASVYVNRHFDEPQRSEIIDSMKQRFQQVDSEIKIKVGVSLESLSLKENPPVPASPQPGKVASVTAINPTLSPTKVETPATTSVVTPASVTIPVTPTDSKVLEKTERLSPLPPTTLISRLQAMHLMLGQSLDPQSKFHQWVTTWPNEKMLSEFSQQLLQEIDKISPKGRYAPPPIIAIMDAIRNLEKNPQMLEGMLNSNAKLMDLYSKYIEFLEQANKDYHQYLSQTVGAGPSPVAPSPSEIFPATAVKPSTSATVSSATTASTSEKMVASSSFASFSSLGDVIAKIEENLIVQTKIGDRYRNPATQNVFETTETIKERIALKKLPTVEEYNNWLTALKNGSSVTKDLAVQLEKEGMSSSLEQLQQQKQMFDKAAAVLKEYSTHWSTPMGLPHYFNLNEIPEENKQRVKAIADKLGLKYEGGSSISFTSADMPLHKYSEFVSTIDGVWESRKKDQQELERLLREANTIDEIINILKAHDNQNKEMLSKSGVVLSIKDQINAIEHLRNSQHERRVKVTSNYGLEEKVKKLTEQEKLKAQTHEAPRTDEKVSSEVKSATTASTSATTAVAPSKEISAVARHLTQVEIPPVISQLTAISEKNIKGIQKGNPGIKSLWDAAKSKSSDWVKMIYAKTERELIADLKKVPPPATFTLEEIQKAHEASNKDAKAEAKPPTLTIVQGMNVSALHTASLGQDCILQVASQFNFLESPGTQIVDVSAYIYDPTQGPRASVEATAAALHRKAAKDAGGLPDALDAILPESIKLNPQAYQNGYLQLPKMNPAEKQELLVAIRENIGKMRVLPQWVTCDVTGARQMQVFCAAPSFQGFQQAQSEDEKEICKALVVAQYIATAQLAVIRSRETGQVVPLHLSLVGQGVFKNDPNVMKEAMEAVGKIVKGEKVAVYIHAFGQKDVDLLDSQMKDGLKDKIFTVEKMQAAEFIKKPHPAAPQSQAAAPQSQAAAPQAQAATPQAQAATPQAQSAAPQAQSAAPQAQAAIPQPQATPVAASEPYAYKLQQEQTSALRQIMSGWSKNNIQFSRDHYKQFARDIYRFYDLPSLFKELTEIKVELTDQKQKSIFLHNANLFIAELIQGDANQRLKELNNYLQMSPEERKEKLADNNVDKTIQSFVEFVKPDPNDTSTNKVLLKKIEDEAEIDAKKVMAAEEEQKKITEIVLSSPEQVEGRFKLEEYLHLTLKTQKPSIEELRKNMNLVAVDLKHRQLALLLKIPPTEITAKAFASPQKMGANNLSQLISEFNSVSGKVRDDILLASSQQHQQNIYNCYVILMDECVKNRNYNGAMMIMGALKSSSISRLKYLPENLNKDKKLKSVLQECERILEQMGNAKELRALYSKHNKNNEEMIPYMGNTSSDITFAEDGNQDLLPDDSQNLSKLEVVGRVIASLQHSQSIGQVYLSKQSNQDLLPHTDLLEHVTSLRLSEDEAHDRSLKVFRRPKDGEKVVPFKESLASREDILKSAKVTSTAKMPQAAVAGVEDKPPIPKPVEPVQDVPPVMVATGPEEKPPIPKPVEPVQDMPPVMVAAGPEEKPPIPKPVEPVQDVPPLMEAAGPEVNPKEATVVGKDIPAPAKPERIVQAGSPMDWSNAELVEALYQFSKKEFLAENMDFIFEMAKLKQAILDNKPSSEIVTLMRTIEGKYLDPESATQVNLPDKVAREEDRLKRLFDAEVSAKDNLKDTLFRFANSDFNKKGAFSPSKIIFPSLTYQEISPELKKSIVFAVTAELQGNVFSAPSSQGATAQTMSTASESAPLATADAEKAPARVKQPVYFKLISLFYTAEWGPKMGYTRGEEQMRLADKEAEQADMIIKDLIKISKKYPDREEVYAMQYLQGVTESKNISPYLRAIVESVLPEVPESSPVAAKQEDIKAAPSSEADVKPAEKNTKSQPVDKVNEKVGARKSAPKIKKWIKGLRDGLKSLRGKSTPDQENLQFLSEIEKSNKDLLYKYDKARSSENLKECEAIELQLESNRAIVRKLMNDPNPDIRMKAKIVGEILFEHIGLTQSNLKFIDKTKLLSEETSLEDLQKIQKRLTALSVNPNHEVRFKASEVGKQISKRIADKRVAEEKSRMETDSKKGVELFNNKEGQDPVKLGEALGRSPGLLKGFMSQMDFTNQELGSALKGFLEQGGFKMPGEGQVVDRYMEAFAERYVQCNPQWENKDNVHLISVALVMLNTDLHNPAVPQKMSREEFIKERKVKEIAGIKDIDKILGDLYDYIKNNEIKMPAPSAHTTKIPQATVAGVENKPPIPKPVEPVQDVPPVTVAAGPEDKPPIPKPVEPVQDMPPVMVAVGPEDKPPIPKPVEPVQDVPPVMVAAGPEEKPKKETTPQPDKPATPQTPIKGILRKPGDAPKAKKTVQFSEKVEEKTIEVDKVTKGLTKAEQERKASILKNAREEGRAKVFSTPEEASASRDQIKFKNVFWDVQEYLDEQEKLGDKFVDPDVQKLSEMSTSLRKDVADMIPISRKELEVFSKLLDKQKDVILQSHANAIANQLKLASERYSVVEPPSKPIADSLQIAAEVAKNSPAWLIEEDKPERGAGGKLVHVVRVVGEEAIEKFEMDLTRGESYAYQTTDIQGLTPVSATSLLYGTMAPDQYLLPEAVSLDPVIERLVEVGLEIRGEEAKKDKEKISQEIRETLQGVKIKDPNDSKYWGEIVPAIVGGKQLTKNQFVMLAAPLQALIGSEHVKRIADKVGVGEPKKYAVLTITGNVRSETRGFGVKESFAIPDKQSVHKVDNIDENGKTIQVSTVAAYTGHHPNISQQLVLQSGGKIGKDRGLITVAGSDLDHIVEFYDSTMKKRIPVAVNCTDGIDRTGMTMTALMMLHHYNQGNDISKKSNIEQQRELMNMIEGLRKDRGPFFLRGTADISIAITMGYALIATQKQRNFQEKLSQDPALATPLKGLLEKVNKMEPEELQEALIKLSDKLGSSDKKLAEDWLAVVQKRVATGKAFVLANNPSTGYHHLVSNLNRHNTEDGEWAASRTLVKSFSQLAKQGFNPSIMVKKAGEPYAPQASFLRRLAVPFINAAKALGNVIRQGIEAVPTLLGLTKAQADNAEKATPKSESAENVTPKTSVPAPQKSPVEVEPDISPSLPSKPPLLSAYKNSTNSPTVAPGTKLTSGAPEGPAPLTPPQTVEFLLKVMKGFEDIRGELFKEARERKELNPRDPGVSQTERDIITDMIRNAFVAKNLVLANKTDSNFSIEVMNDFTQKLKEISQAPGLSEPLRKGAENLLKEIEPKEKPKFKT